MKDDVLEAVAAAFEAGLAPAEALAVIARAGPASARLARLLSDGLRAGSLAEALARTGLIAREEQAVVALGEESGRLPAALRWAVERSRTRRERRRAVGKAVIGPLLFATLALVAERAPALVVGGASWRSALAALVVFVVAAAASSLALFRVATHPGLRARLRRLGRGAPLVGALVTLADEDQAAALIALFADADALALAPRAARAVVPQPYVDALTAAAADPRTPVAAFSEPFALALAVGVRAGDLPSRFAAFHRRAAQALTARLRLIARVLAFAVVLVVALHSVISLLSTPLPGLGGDLGASPEMRALERELENAGH